MPLASSTLSTQLQAALATLNGPSAPDAPTTIAAAWAAYFKTASLSGTPPVPAAVDAGASALKAALTFTNGSAAAGASIWQTAIAAFWTHLQGAASTYWPGATPGTPPAGITAIGAGLVSQFGVNINPSTTTAQAAANIAGVLHASGGIGGTVTVATVPIAIL
jgi:hypothetical protein